MANDKYFLQMSECQWPDHVFISTVNDFKICIYHRLNEKSAPLLYCITSNDEEHPITIQLLNSKNEIMNHKKWTIITSETNSKIKHSFCQFSIKFESLPKCFDQPLKLRFHSSKNIQAFTTNPFRVVRYQLKILREPPAIFYKDDGGMRNNHMTIKVALINPIDKNKKKCKNVSLKCRLITEDGKEIIGRMKKKGHNNNNNDDDDYEKLHNGYHKKNKNKQKSRPPSQYLQLHEDCSEPKINKFNNECYIKFRINDVSQNHKNQGFHVVIQPNVEKYPDLCDVYQIKSTKITVKSKSPQKLHEQKKKGRKRSLANLYSSNDEYENQMNNKSKRSRKKLLNGHNTRSKSKLNKKRKKYKLRHKHNHKTDNTDEYDPNLTDNTDIDIDIDIDINNNNIQIKKEINGHNNDSQNNLRKRRKINDTDYIKTNGNQNNNNNNNNNIYIPHTFETKPKINWFPSLNILHNNNKNSSTIGPEQEMQLFAQNCFNLLSYREWICIGYQTDYIDDNVSSRKKKHKHSKSKYHQKYSKIKQIQIVRCLLCKAEGSWTLNKQPKHNKGCDFMRLKKGFKSMKHLFTKLNINNSNTSINDNSIMPRINSENNDYFNRNTNTNTNTNTRQQQQQQQQRTTIISPKIHNLPPLPPHQPNTFPPNPHHQYPSYPHHQAQAYPPHPSMIAPFPPFFTPIPPMFGQAHSYTLLSSNGHTNQSLIHPPPLIHASSSGTNDDISNSNKNKSNNNNEKELNKKKKKIVIKKQPNPADKNNNSSTNNKHNNHNNNNNNKTQSSPVVFPFNPTSPTIFPSTVPPITSPLFSITHQIPHTPQMYALPSSSNSNNSNNNNNNNKNGTLLPPSNPNNNQNGNHHSSLNNYTSRHPLSNFATTAATLPMPLQIPTTTHNIISPIHTTNNFNNNDNNNSNSNSNSNSTGDNDNNNNNSNNNNSIDVSNNNSNNNSESNNNSSNNTPRAQSLNPPMSTMTAVSGITADPNSNPPDSITQIIHDQQTNDNIGDNMDNHHHNNNNNISIREATPNQNQCSSVAATAGNGDNTSTIITNPIENDNHHHDQSSYMNLSNMPTFTAQRIPSSRTSSIGGNTANATIATSRSPTNSECTSNNTNSKQITTVTSASSSSATNNNNNNNNSAHSIDSQSVSISAPSTAATAGGLSTFNIPPPLPSGSVSINTINSNIAVLPSIPSHSNSVNPPDNNNNVIDNIGRNMDNQNETNQNNNNNNTTQMIAAHAPPALNTRNKNNKNNSLLINHNIDVNQLTIPTPPPSSSPSSSQQTHNINVICQPLQIIQQQNSNNSIETQLGSMPPLQRHSNNDNDNDNETSQTNNNNNNKPLPLHERRRLMKNTPATLNIPSNTNTNANTNTSFTNMT